MATNYQQAGTTLDFNNTGNAIIMSGDAVAVGGITGVAHDDIPPGLWGTLHMTGVFVLPKVDEPVGTGQALYLSDGRLTVQAKAGNKDLPFAGHAWESADAATPVVAVRLGR